MSEGRHHDTEHAAEEEVDLEELLEQFREPEEPRKKRGNPVWLILAAIVSGLGFWMAMKATTGTLSFVRQTPAKMKPTKVRDRASLPGPVDDIAADYAERCRKGLSSLEIRWILEDFQNAGLGEGPGSLASVIATSLPGSGSAKEARGETGQLDRMADQLAARYRSWYRHALADGLRLDGNQQRDLKQKLAEAHEEDWLEFKKSEDDGVDRPQDLLGSDAYHRFVMAEAWLDDDHYAPWNLCTLAKDQISITRRDDAVEQQLAVVAAGEAEEAPSWFELRPSSPTSVDTTSPSSMERESWDAEAIFPFTGDQEIPEQDANDLLEIARRLHPAQLKILLLLEPAAADELMSELNRKGE